ncbi:FGGY family carbohydrate kinase [Sulfitobacter donghicola]|uniref:ATP:glycerol 3-phosphotransferase n=1 Tax=Sulfitobacter donghicola DSW-25 = KCTC 12864 = JCM 14565 TaxID=1300350 RepID=A0A073IDW0_9RHOB|nr:FGGY family carbohydrate kinase [Sulfitobacter donghicola]KEJ88508.1 glycerol kinase [Sulfitobacter donghicola DSW-25 = KCTC 12864 = JCM 14565]KIN69614.1 Glycerol kinase [Sulfitobacter donghicola DSW-25 = KCTC 12864 = JCM 14565]
MTLLAIDQSTTSTTALLFDVSGGVRTVHRADHKQIYPKQGWVEHDPLEILGHIRRSLDAGKEQGAQAFALSNQGESCLAWDRKTGDPISPMIVWQDNRTEAACKSLELHHGNTVAQRARLPLSPYFSAAKLGWVLQNIPAASDLAKNGRLALGTSDAFFRDQLTGRFETDVATASRTSLMNLETCQWDPQLCEVFGVPIACLPKITDCSGDLGAAQGLPLAAAIVDQQAALYGHGVSHRGESKFTFGTGAFAQTFVGPDCPPFAQGVAPTVAWREVGQKTVYALDGGIHTAAAAVNWARDLGLFHEFSELEGFCGHALERGLAFVPALAGLACPHWDNNAKGTWLGLSLGTTKADMMQALLEGIAYRAAEVCAAMEQVVPPNGAVLVDGGMSANPWFCQLLANVTGRSIKAAQMSDITAYGAAKMAGNALGLEIPSKAARSVFEPEAGFSPQMQRFEEARNLAQSWLAKAPV